MTIVYFTRYSGAGKSTIADALSRVLPDSVVLDGDVVRKAYANDLPHGTQGAKDNTLRLIELAKEHFKTRQYVITSFVAPKASLRVRVKRAMEKDGIRFVEVYIRASLETCAKRDVKGLYQRYAENEDIRALAGLNEPYDVPKNPHIICDTDRLTVQESVSKICTYLEKN